MPPRQANGIGHELLVDEVAVGKTDNRKIGNLAGAVYFRVAGQDLFGEGSAGPRHADNENRGFVLDAVTLTGKEEIRIEGINNFVKRFDVP